MPCRERTCVKEQKHTLLKFSSFALLKESQTPLSNCKSVTVTKNVIKVLSSSFGSGV